MYKNEGTLCSTAYISPLKINLIPKWFIIIKGLWAFPVGQTDGFLFEKGLTAKNPDSI